MKAIVYHRYGSPDVLECAEIERPVPGAREVLVRVRAASVNPFDWHFMRGLPYFVRIASGWRKPAFTRLGVDVAGEVESVGSGITEFKKGDAVFGGGRGTFAEYVTVPESALVLKPAHVTFEQAASAPIAALAALQALRAKGAIRPGQTVLINGAAGGIGTFAVQIARSFGARVTGVCSTPNAAMVRAIGADVVIDYTQENFTKRRERYDVILDCIGNHPLSACRKVLAADGKYVAIGGPTGRWMIGALGRMAASVALSPFVQQKLILFLGKMIKADLAFAGALMESGKVTPVIECRYLLADVPEALRYLEGGHARGKVVITVSA